MNDKVGGRPRPSLDWFVRSVIVIEELAVEDSRGAWASYSERGVRERLEDGRIIDHLTEEILRIALPQTIVLRRDRVAYEILRARGRRVETAHAVRVDPQKDSGYVFCAEPAATQEQWAAKEPPNPR